VKRHSKKVRKEWKTAEISLKNLGKALNACEKQKVHVKLQQGIVMSRYGYVLPLRRGWTVRMLLKSQFDDDFEDI
jgi:hypothetical protein